MFSKCRKLSQRNNKKNTVTKIIYVGSTLVLISFQAILSSS